MRQNQILNNFIYISVLCVAILQLPVASDAARILGFFPSTSKSHLLIHCAIAETLADAGHEVTVLGGLPNVYKNAKYKYLQIGDSAGFHNFASEMVNDPQPIYIRFKSMMDNIIGSVNRTMSKAAMQNFLKEHNASSFDLVIVGYFMNDFTLGIGAHFKCPIIVSVMLQPIYTVNKFIGNPREYAYVPTIFSGLQQPMSFMQRVQNYLSGLLDQYYVEQLITAKNRELYNHYFPASRYPPLDEVMKNISLVFSNHHSHSQGPIRPNVPALIEIGGIQMKDKTEPLPADIAQILDNSKNGVIYFSLGSNVQGSLLSESTTKTIFTVLSQLPYTVLWKWSDTNLPGTSENIIFKSWLPQDDILAHPNVKLFITHAGQGSVVEAQCHGVPMVAIPLFIDQPANAANLEKAGFGVKLDYTSLTEDNVRAAIKEVLGNQKYSQAVQKFSKLYRDRPMTPRQLVVYWTEYVLRHEGARHLRSPALDLNYFQLMSLDVLLLLSVLLLSILFVFVKIFHYICYKKINCKKDVCPEKSAKKTN